MPSALTSWRQDGTFFWEGIVPAVSLRQLRLARLHQEPGQTGILSKLRPDSLSHCYGPGIGPLSYALPLDVRGRLFLPFVETPPFPIMLGYTVLPPCTLHPEYR